MTKVKNTAKYKIKITKNGPYLVSGGVPLSGQTMPSAAAAGPVICLFAMVPTAKLILTVKKRLPGFLI